MNVEDVQTPEVRSVLWLYKNLYQPERRCGCGPTTGYYPNNTAEVRASSIGLEGEGLVKVQAVCRLHEWRARRKAEQDKLVSSGLSLPIPEWVKKALHHPTLVPYLKAARDNPLDVSMAPWTARDREAGTRANWLARWLSRDQDERKGFAAVEHVVTYLTFTQVMDMKIRGNREQGIKDALVYSPILVYWHNNGKSEWIKALVSSRSCGLTFMVEDA